MCGEFRRPSERLATFSAKMAFLCHARSRVGRVMRWLAVAVLTISNGRQTVACMGPLMGCQLRGPLESFPTLRTEVVLVLVVSFLMSGEFRGPPEPFPTFRAEVRLLDCMRLYHITIGRGFLTCKNILDYIELGGPRKQSVSIHGVVQRLFNGMDPLMDDELRGPPESLATFDADMAFLTHVGFLMPGEMRGSTKLFPTLSAVIGFGPGVDFLM